MNNERMMILHKIDKERMRQDLRFGRITKRMLETILPVLVEEVGEVGKALLNNDFDNLEVELVQVAAVCVKWLEIILLKDSPSRKKGK